MKFDKYKKLTQNYNLIPVYEIITADMLTPVLAYLKLRSIKHQSFLLESVEGEDSIARYSFIGNNPIITVSTTGEYITVKEGNNKKKIKKNVFNHLEEIIKK